MTDLTQRARDVAGRLLRPAKSNDTGAGLPLW